MARKKLNDLAKIGLGLAAAYGASKVLGGKDPMEIAKLEGAEADINAMEGPARRSMYAGPQSSIDIARREAKDSAFNQMEGADRESMTASTMSPRGSVEAFKAREVDKPTSTYYEGKLGVKWPDKKTEERYIKQIKERYQYPAQSFEFNQKVKSGELLTDKGLAKEFGISNDSVERINRYIKNTEGLSYPKAEISEQEKERLYQDLEGKMNGMDY